MIFDMLGKRTAQKYIELLMASTDPQQFLACFSVGLDDRIIGSVKIVRIKFGMRIKLFYRNALDPRQCRCPELSGHQ